MDFRTLKLAMPHPDNGVDFRAHPEPYKSELLPLWACRDLETARRSAEVLYARYLAYREAGDFVGMGWTWRASTCRWATRARAATPTTGAGASAGPTARRCPPAAATFSMLPCGTDAGRGRR